MNQGQVCKLRRRSDGKDLGWYQKLRMEDGEIKFCQLNSAVIALYGDNEVDGSERNKYANRPYEAFHVVPAHMQVLATSFMADGDLEREIEREASAAVIEAQLAKMKAKYEAAQADCLRKVRAVADAKEKSRRMREDIDDLTACMRSVRNGNPVSFSYAYGVHAPGGDEYCWRIPASLKEQVSPGAAVVVDTQYGDQPAIVSRIERRNEFLPHKCVLSVEQQ